MNKKEFHKVFKKHYQELCRFAYIIVNCTENADEIVQKSFISFWENRNSLQIKKDAKSYLYKTVKNIAINYLKSNNTRKSYEHEYFEMSSKVQPAEIDRIFFNDKLKEAIILLPERCRIVYCLKYIEGLNYKEIASYLDISSNTVDNHIQKALKKLKEELGKYKTEFYNN